MLDTSRLRAILAATLLVASLGACSGGHSAVDSAEAPAMKQDSVHEDRSATEIEAESSPMEGDPTSADENREIVVTGRLMLSAEDVAGAAQEIAEIAEAAGGRVESRQLSSAEESRPTAELTIRVPSDATSSTIGAFDDLGEVLDSSVESTDVTGTARDLDARISALQTSVDRLEALLSDAATTADLLDAERELTQRQADLEALQSERTLIADHVAMSTLTITIRTPQDQEPENRGSFIEGLQDGWSALVNTAGTAVTVIGVLLPWVGLGLLVWLVALGVVRLRHRRGTGRNVSGSGGSAEATASAGEEPASRPAPQGEPVARAAAADPDTATGTATDPDSAVGTDTPSAQEESPPA